MKTTRRSRWASLGLVALACTMLELPMFVGRAEAIIGRPLTPVSYAGVARRTTRRTVAYSAAVHPYAHPYYW